MAPHWLTIVALLAFAVGFPSANGFSVARSRATREALPQDPLDDDADYVEEEEESIIQDIPEFVTASGTVWVRPGERLRLTCQLNKDDDRISIMWTRKLSDSSLEDQLFLNNMRLNENKRFRVRRQPESQTLTVDDVGRDDEGSYSCKLMAPGDKHVTFEVRVGEAPNTEGPGSAAEGEPTEAEGVSDSNAGKGGAAAAAGVGWRRGGVMLLAALVALLVGRV